MVEPASRQRPAAGQAPSALLAQVAWRRGVPAGPRPALPAPAAEPGAAGASASLALVPGRRLAPSSLSPPRPPRRRGSWPLAARGEAPRAWGAPEAAQRPDAPARAAVPRRPGAASGAPAAWAAEEGARPARAALRAQAAASEEPAPMAAAGAVLPGLWPRPPPRRTASRNDRRP